MKPYLLPNPNLAFVIEWGVLIISILLVFSPFIYLGIRKWKKHLLVSWAHVAGAYLLSFVIYPIWDWWILGKVDRYIYDNYVNSGWLQDAISDPGFRMIFIVVIAWPLLVFYSSKLITKGRFTLLNFIISLGASILLLIALVALWAFLVVVGLGYIGRTYF